MLVCLFVCLFFIRFCSVDGIGPKFFQASSYLFRAGRRLLFTPKFYVVGPEQTYPSKIPLPVQGNESEKTGLCQSHRCVMEIRRQGVFRGCWIQKWCLFLLGARSFYGREGLAGLLTASRGQKNIAIWFSMKSVAIGFPMWGTRIWVNLSW